MDFSPAEDENGVDIAQLQERLALTHAERVDRLVEEVRMWSEIRRPGGLSEISFDPRKICSALNDEGVDYVVIGGFAAVVRGSPLPTEDVDIVPRRTPANLERLTAALGALAARPLADDGEVVIDRAFLEMAPSLVDLTTSHGDLGIAFETAGPRPVFDNWIDAAEALRSARASSSRSRVSMRSSSRSSPRAD